MFIAVKINNNKNVKITQVSIDRCTDKRRSLGEGNGNPLHYFCLGNPVDRGAWRATVHGVANLATNTFNTF